MATKKRTNFKVKNSLENTETPDVSAQVLIRPPMGIPGVYAQLMTAHRAEEEYLLTFYELVPQSLKGKEVNVAECVSRIIVSKNRLPDFIKALQDISSPIEGLSENAVLEEKENA